jgi:hypothetical protein
MLQKLVDCRTTSPMGPTDCRINAPLPAAPVRSPRAIQEIEELDDVLDFFGGGTLFEQRQRRSQPLMQLLNS